MGTGPGAGAGTDAGPGSEFGLALTEHRLLVRSGSAKGADVLTALPQRPTDTGTSRAAEATVAEAAAHMGHSVPPVSPRALRGASPEAERWNPTGDHAERRRRWNSCFDRAFSYLHSDITKQTWALHTECPQNSENPHSEEPP